MSRQIIVPNLNTRKVHATFKQHPPIIWFAINSLLGNNYDEFPKFLYNEKVINCSMLDRNLSLDQKSFLALVSQSGLDLKPDHLEKLYSQFSNVISNNNALYKINVRPYEPSSIFTTNAY